MKTPKLGQHFLVDRTVIDRMAIVANITKDDLVVEIGPGKGILTDALVDSAGQVIAIEKDGELHHKLKKRYKDADNIELVHEDIRNFNISSVQSPYKVVANIPYYITGQLIPMFLTAPNPPLRMVLMIQNEVADRLTAPEGNSSILQITTQVFSDVKKEFFVPPDSFAPPPNVDSAVISIDVLPESRLPLEQQRSFFRFLKFGFAGKRKKLSNTMPGALKISKTDFLEALDRLELSQDSRPQELGTDEWIGLYKEVTPLIS